MLNRRETSAETYREAPRGQNSDGRGAEIEEYWEDYDLATRRRFLLRIVHGRRASARAALVSAPGARVHGLVFSLTLAELDQLYSEPSVQAYRPEAVLARLANGGVIAALCYNLPQPPSPTERNPEYAAKLRAVAQKVGFPAEYVASLQ
jgi:hypothetical protein